MKTRKLTKENAVEFVERELSIKIRSTIKKRQTEYVFARAMVYYICVEHLNMTYTSSGKLLKKTHATVLHSVKTILPQLVRTSPYGTLMNKIDKIFDLGGDLLEAEIYFERLKEIKVNEAKNLTIAEENKVLKDKLSIMERKMSFMPKNDEIYRLLEGMPKRKRDEAEESVLRSLRLVYNA